MSLTTEDVVVVGAPMRAVRCWCDQVFAAPYEVLEVIATSSERVFCPHGHENILVADQLGGESTT